MIRDLWSAAAVGVIGGLPKSCKSWFGLDLAVSVASCTAALDRFEVLAAGPALVYLAEDSLPRVRERVAHLCRHRGLDLAALDLHVVTAESLRLDRDRDQHALDETLGALRPALLLLDPLVRLHRLDENSAADIAALLGFLRELNRRHQVALILVHHLAKRSRRNLGQALRGSSDLHAWTDSACYLARRGDGRLLLTVEHRSAPAPDPVLLRLHGGGHQPLALRLDDDHAASPPLAEAVRAALRHAAQPLSRTSLRQRLRVNNSRLGDALLELDNKASPSATATAGACRRERTLLTPMPCVRAPAVPAVPHQGRTRNGTLSAIAYLDRSTTSWPALTRCRQSLQSGNRYRTATIPADQIAGFPSTTVRALTTG